MPPIAFLDELLSLIAPLPDALFTPNPNHDIYSLLAPSLGPWQTLHRKAAMAEALMVDGGFESDWNWNEGADQSAPPGRPIEQLETGLWQVSYDALNLAPEILRPVCVKYDVFSAEEFLPATKENHRFAIEFGITLFRVSTRWSGPCNEGWVARDVSRVAVAEWETALTT